MGHSLIKSDLPPNNMQSQKMFLQTCDFSTPVKHDYFFLLSISKMSSIADLFIRTVSTWRNKTTGYRLVQLHQVTKSELFP